MNGIPTFSSSLPSLKQTDSQSSLRVDTNTHLKFSKRTLPNKSTQQKITKYTDIHYVPIAYKRHEETEKELRLIGNLQHASSFKTFKSEAPPLLTYTLGPSEGVKTLNEMLRSHHSPSSSSGSEGTVTRQFACGKYQPNKTCKKDFYLPTGGDGKEWTRKIFDILRTDQSSMKFNVLLTYSNEVLVQFTIDLYQFSRQKYEDLNAYMNSLILHGLGSEFILRKRGDRWGRLEPIALDNDQDNYDSNNKNNDQGDIHVSDNPFQTAVSSSSSSSVASLDLVSKINCINESSNHADRDCDNNTSPHQPQPQHQKQQKLMCLCYSMYTPWVSGAASSVHRAAGQFDRQKARHVRAAVQQHRAQFN